VRIRRISLKNFGGVDSSDVTFEDGVTVVEGDNEAGKTTMIRALDAIIEYQDSSKSKKIKSLVPVGRDVGPEAEIEVETGDYAFTYRKRWVKNTETVLDITKPRRRQLTGGDAHNEVARILGETLDSDLWKALRLEQATSLEQEAFGGSSIGRALDAASGVEAAGDEADALWDQIESEYARYWTKTGKPRDEFASARKELDEAGEADRNAREHLASLDEHASDIERLTEQAATLAQATTDADAAVAELEESLGAITEIRRQLAMVTSERDVAKAAVESAVTAHERRLEQIEMLTDKEQELAEIEEDVTAAAPERELLTTEMEAATSAAAQSKRGLHDALRVRERARSDAELLRRDIEVVLLGDRRDRIGTANEDIAKATATIESITIDGDLLAEVEAAYLHVVELRAAVGRVFPVVRIEAMRDVAVDIDGTSIELSEGDEKEITGQGRTEITVPNMVGIVVTVGSDGTDVVTELADAERVLRESCERGGVEGFQDARASFDLKAEAERLRDQAYQTIKRELGDLTLEALVHKIESLTTKIESYRATRGGEPPLPSDHSDAQSKEDAAEEALEKAQETADYAAQRAESARDRMGDLDKAVAGREGKLEIARGAVDSSSAVLGGARSEQSDQELADAVAKASDAHEKAAGSVDALDTKLRDMDAVRLDALLDNARSRRKRSRADLADVVESKRVLEITLRVETERGPARLLDDAASQLVEAERRFEAIERRALAVELLHSTFERHRDEAHRRYIQPFRDEVERLGRIVYGATFEVGLAEDLTIETRTLDAETLAFEQLSTGAQEQLGVLSRLACARLVSDDGGVPVVLDDALGWTDPERLGVMGAAISTVADDCQVIILTCVPDRYAAVGKARTVRI
jgi:uncharacterized protein YhaN